MAFFEERTIDGQLVPIEKGGHFYHVAIQFGDLWLEAHPYYGVRKVSNVHDLGQLYSIIELDREVPLEKYQVEFGKRFSVVDPWENQKFTYCSKLVAQILDIEPMPMKNNKGMGISPDGLYSVLKAAPHKEIHFCTKIFN